MSTQPFPSSTGATSAVGGSGGSDGSGARRNPLLLVIGVLLVVAGIVGGLVLVARASSSVGDNAEKLARAPGGCTTSLQFDRTGTFLVFYESKGKVGDLGGNCTGNGASFDSASSSPPTQTLKLVGPDKKSVALDDASGTSYDASGFKGTEIAKVTIDSSGVYLLTVSPRQAKEADYAIAIGKNPTSDRGTLRAAGLGTLIAGVVIGALLILLGLRKRGGSGTYVPTSTPTLAWNPVSPAVTWQTQPQQPPTLSPPGYTSPAPPPPPPATSPWMPADPSRQPPSPFAPPSPPSGGA
jgi:hypothetical protein